MVKEGTPLVFDIAAWNELFNGKYHPGQQNWIEIPWNADETYIHAVRDYAATLRDGPPYYVEVTGGEVWNEISNVSNERWRNYPPPKDVMPRVVISPAERARRQFANRKTRV